MTGDYPAELEYEPLTPFREFLATRPMTQVGLLISQVGKMKGESLYLKAPHCTRDKDGAYIEGYQSGGDTVNLIVQYGKSVFDDAKLKITDAINDLDYSRKQLAKVENEIARGQEGRRGDLAKFESEVVRLQALVNDYQEIIDNPQIEHFTFKLEDCK